MLRIKGLVAVERALRERLRSGIPQGEVERFRGNVQRAVQAVESALARNRLTPADLPGPTRQAYLSLKGIDLDKLPITDGAPPPAGRLVGIKNVTSSARFCSAALAHLATEERPDAARLRQVADRLSRDVRAIEQICGRYDAAPSAMGAPSRQAYAWMKLLTVPVNLERHLDAMRRAMSIARRLLAARGAPPGRVVVEFVNSATFGRYRQQGGAVRIELAEGFIAADDGVLEALIGSVVLEKSAGRRKRYVDFTHTEAYRDVLLELDLAAEVDADQPRGAAHDLDEVFEAVNAAYFGGRMSRPRLAWSDRLSTRQNGRFVPHHDRVVVSRTLDSPSVPRFVVEFVVYHELLHRKLGSVWSGSRARFHTSEFRREERRFARWQEAEEWLRSAGAFEPNAG